MQDILIVGSVSDNPFVDDIVQHMNQQEDYSDLISLKNFLNSEFCPRFIVNESSWENIGNKLKAKTILLVSNSMSDISRNDLAMRNMLIARGAKDNGAERVILLEPDLFYSAQDRGPRKEHGLVGFKRSREDYKKFDGQPFSARLYADLLAKSGVDEVVTIHNHSCSVKNIFFDRFAGGFHNLEPTDVYSNYILESDVADISRLVLCAPDAGALPFALGIQEELGKNRVPLLIIAKKRSGERDVEMNVSASSDIGLDELKGKDIIVVDDMVRTGGTIVESCRLISRGDPHKVVFFVTHFYSNREGRVNLNDPSINEIVTTNTIPQILNRDTQGRLRHKMVVLLLERWISRYLTEMFGGDTSALTGVLYREDMSSKNPRWKGKMGPLFSS